MKNLPAVQETLEIWVRFLGWEDPLEEGIAAHSSILAWRIPMDRGTWQATVHGVTKLDITEWLSTAYTYIIYSFNYSYFTLSHTIVNINQVPFAKHIDLVSN